MNHNGSERERFLLVLFYAVVLLTGYLAFSVVAPFLSSLAWGASFAMVLNPVQSRLARRLSRGQAATATTVLATLIIVGPVIGVTAALVGEVTSAVERIQSGGPTIHTPPEVQRWYAHLQQQTLLPLPADLTSALSDAVHKGAAFLSGQIGSIAQNVASFVLQLFVMLFALFYFLRDGARIIRLIRQLLPFEPARRDRIIHQTYELVVATIGSTFTVAIVQGNLMGLALGLLGFHSPVFWGVVTAFASLLPVVGSGLVWVPAAFYLFASGDILRAVILLVVGAGVVGVADNILRPILLSGRTTMHGLLVFISLMGGAAAFGLIGLVVGPVIIATLGTLLGAVKDEGPLDGPLVLGGPDMR
jgi:predicted PurR-regulated permease PerM